MGGKNQCMSSRAFLVAILKNLGKEISPSLTISEWEIFDMIMKDIDLRKDSGRRLRSEVRKLRRKVEVLKQVNIWFKGPATKKGEEND